MGSEDIGLSEYFEEMDRVESVIGGASESECTYTQGYLSRQAVYSCLDCTPPTSDVMAGFCHACYVNCHSTHHVEEIYTKRNFRCDCGTIPQLLCSLKTDVDVRNENNKYSQNFKGLYCQCARPYPDEERPEMDTVEMIQCFVCEDWFHTTHLNTVVPERYDEMACPACAGRLSFLAVYALPEVENRDVEGCAVEDDKTKCESVSVSLKCSSDIVKPVKKQSACDPVPLKQEHDALKYKSEDSKPNDCNSSQSGDLKRPASDSSACEPSSKRKKTDSCKLGLRDASSFETLTRAIFFNDRFRDFICKCQSCLDLYKEHNFSFVTDPNDSLNKYEEKAQEKRQKEEAELNKTLESLPHQAKCDVARAIGSLKSTLDGLMSKIAREGKEAVGRAEIVEAFKTMAAETNTVDPSIFDNVGK